MMNSVALRSAAATSDTKPTARERIRIGFIIISLFLPSQVDLIGR